MLKSGKRNGPGMPRQLIAPVPWHDDTVEAKEIRSLKRIIGLAP